MTTSVHGVGQLVRRAAQQFADREAWTFLGGDEPERWTFAAVDRGVDGVGHLLSRHTDEGDRVAIMLPNSSDFPLTWLGCARSGRIAVPLNAKAMPVDAAHVLRDSGARLVVTTTELMPVVHEAIVLLDGDAPVVVDAREVRDAAGGPPSSSVSAASDSQRVVNVQYTSGTTGLPKGCMLSHTYWLQIARSLTAGFPEIGPDDVLYTAQPFSYIDPQWNVVTALMAGARLVVDTRFSASSMWERVREHKVTLFYCLGIMPAALLAQPPSERDRHHRLRCVLASAIPVDLHAALEERWGVPWHEAYGMTESGADLILGPDDHDTMVGSACLGRVHHGKEVLVADTQGRPVPAGTQGELLIRGVGLMDGYWRRPEATAEVFRDGWLHSGDLVVQDDEGRVHYRGRIKDMVRRSGENISAREVEAVLEAHPAVAVAAIVGVPDPWREEEVAAYVVPHDGAMPTWQELREHCVARITGFKVPRYWAIRDQLPMTLSERVAKGELRRSPGDLVDSEGGVA